MKGIPGEPRPVLGNQGVPVQADQAVADLVDPVDPLTFGAVAVSLTSVALLASYLPAYRASMVDPVVAIRFE